VSEQIPLAPFDFARWIHMQRHRFTNDADRDPDHFGYKMDLFTPLRWLNFDDYDTKFLLEEAGDIVRLSAACAVLSHAHDLECAALRASRA